MVAMNVWPTDGVDGSVATEARWRSMARTWNTTGVVRGIGAEMAPALAFPNLTVTSGGCWVDGHYCELAGDQVLTVTANGLAVVRFDPAANSAELLYRDGATTPIQNLTGVWEVPIAQLAGAAMTDLRFTFVDGTPGANPDGTPGRALPGAVVDKAWDDAVVNTLAANAPRNVVRGVASNGFLAIEAGSTLITTNAGGDANIALTAPFSSPPVVVATNGDGNAGSLGLGIHDGLTSTTQFSIRVWNAATNGGPVTNYTFRLNYLAIGRRA